MTGPGLSIRVDTSDAGRRLDRFVASRLDGVSRTQVQALNAAGAIRVNGRARPDSYALSAGDTVDVMTDAMAAPAPRVPVAQAIPVAVIYEDESVVVVDKPAGMVVHPAHGNWDGTLVNALLGRGTPLSTLGSGDRPGVVHRLDKDTSGVMVLARTDRAYRSLALQFKEKLTEKTYHAIVVGHLPSRSVTIDEPIARHPVHRQRMSVAASGGRAAVTDVLVVDTFQHFDYIRVSTHTGRTHQIRVHMAHIGNPLLGDPLYGGRKTRGGGSQARTKGTFDRLLKLMPRHALHASRLSFTHPEHETRMTFVTALPGDMRAAVEFLYREERAQETTA
ncbi:MAG TPA: RluA family pseudouridine synthase [Candidatus Krumholzibacteria bacterium]|nr:RluA family pseudouridine synthase [Candidatus Krumholzibacteria bacterium]